MVLEAHQLYQNSLYSESISGVLAPLVNRADSQLKNSNLDKNSIAKVEKLYFGAAFHDLKVKVSKRGLSESFFE